MQSKFMLALAIVAGATSAFGQTPPPPVGGSNGSNPDMADIVVDLRVDNNNPRMGDQVTVTWSLDSSVSHAASGLRANITLANGPEVIRVANDVLASKGRHTFTLTETLIGMLNQPQRFKLRVAVGGHQPELEMTIRPANRRPRIESLEVPTELVAGKDNLVVNGVVTDEDNDPLTYRVKSYDSTVGEWRDVNGASSTLPMNVLLDEVSAEVFVQLRLQATDSSGLSGERDFEVLLMPILQPPPPPPPGDPVGGAGAGVPLAPDPAPVASATAPDLASIDPGVATVSSNTLPNGLRVRVRPSNELTGGQTLDLHWVGQDKDGDALTVILRYRNLSDGVAVVQSSTESPFELMTPYVAARRVLEVEVSLSDGKGESEPQLIELVLLPIDRILVNEREFKEDIRLERPTMGRRMEEAGMFSPGAIGHELVEDADGNMTVRKVPSPTRRK